METEDMRPLFCHPGRSRWIWPSSGMNFLRFARLCLATVGMTILICAPLHAEEEKKEEPKAEEKKKEEPKKEEATSFRFAPDFCDFSIEFPEAPAIAQKCVQEKCYDVHSYTMVYDLQTTVDVSVTCAPSTPADFKRYNDRVLKAALYGMIDNRNLKSHEISFKEDKTTKNAILIGEGITGSQEKIYSGQLWIGPNSVFTVQAELIGAAHDVADKSFGTILGSIKAKEGKQLPKPKKAPTAPKQNNQ